MSLYLTVLSGFNSEICPKLIWIISTRHRDTSATYAKVAKVSPPQ